MHEPLCTEGASGWSVRARVPLEDLGKLSMPHKRMRYKEGWVRVGVDEIAHQLVLTLEDREGTVVGKPTRLDAIVESNNMGKAVCAYLMSYNRQYDRGAPTN